MIKKGSAVALCYGGVFYAECFVFASNWAGFDFGTALELIRLLSGYLSLDGCLITLLKKGLNF